MFSCKGDGIMVLCEIQNALVGKVEAWWLQVMKKGCRWKCDGSIKKTHVMSLRMPNDDNGRS